LQQRHGLRRDAKQKTLALELHHGDVALIAKRNGLAQGERMLASAEAHGMEATTKGFRKTRQLVVQ